METENLSEQFYVSLVKQVRALDAYGSYAKYNDEELISIKYLKIQRVEASPKKIEMKNDQIAMNIKMYLQAICVTLEKLTGQMTGLMSEAGCDGSVQALIYTGDLIILNKTFGGINGFQYSSLDKLRESGIKLIEKLYGTVKAKTEKYEAFVAAM